MAYDESLANRIRAALDGRDDVTEKKMFGGIAFLLRGKMFIGVIKDDLMVRVGPTAFDDALRRPHVRPMDFTGRPMVGYVFVAAPGTRTPDAVAHWVERGGAFAETLAPAREQKVAKASAGRKPGARPRRREG